MKAGVAARPGMMCLRVILLPRRSMIPEGRGVSRAEHPKAVFWFSMRALQSQAPLFAKVSVAMLHEGPSAASYLLSETHEDNQYLMEDSNSIS